MKVSCGCKCGAEFEQYDDHHRLRRYISGHNHRGKKHSNEWKKKISQTLGSKKGWITPINRRIRNSIRFQEWSRLVKERDNYSCVICGIKGGKLHADHIKPFAIFPELRFELSNGRTLCLECHYLITFNRNKNEDNNWCEKSFRKVVA